MAFVTDKVESGMRIKFHAKAISCHGVVELVLGKSRVLSAGKAASRAAREALGRTPRKPWKPWKLWKLWMEALC